MLNEHQLGGRSLTVNEARPKTAGGGGGSVAAVAAAGGGNGRGRRVRAALVTDGSFGSGRGAISESRLVVLSQSCRAGAGAGR